MFSKVFSSALTLQIGEHSFQFKSTQELEFVLTGRNHAFRATRGVHRGVE